LPRTQVPGSAGEQTPTRREMAHLERKKKRELRPCFYITTNKYNSVLYTGVTSNLFKCVNAHKEKLVSGFTSRYNVTKLVYYEEFETMPEAIAREKQIKGGSRQNKLDLIRNKNRNGKTCTKSSLPSISLSVIARLRSSRSNLRHGVERQTVLGVASSFGFNWRKQI